MYIKLTLSSHHEQIINAHSTHPPYLSSTSYCCVLQEVENNTTIYSLAIKVALFVFGLCGIMFVQHTGPQSVCCCAVFPKDVRNDY